MKTSSDYIKTRSFLAANVDVLLENLNVRRQAGKIAADDLFGEQDGSGSDIPWNKNLLKISKIDVLLQEKESLGLYVSGNPLEDYSDLLNWCREVTNREDLYLILINKVKKIFTKSGGMMFALQISIPDEELEGIIFPKKALDLSPKLEEKQLFWVKGKISRGKGEKTNKTTEEKEVAMDEVVESDVEEEGGAPRQAEIQEYAELPKLLIDNLTRFEEGVLPLFDNDQDKLSINRIKRLKPIDWTRLKTNPDQINQIENESEPPLSKPPESSKNTNQAQIKVSLANSNLQAGVEKLKLPKSMGMEKLKEIKQSLKAHPDQDSVAVELWIESSEGYKKAKGDFWLDRRTLEKFKTF